MRCLYKTEKIHLTHICNAQMVYNVRTLDFCTENVQWELKKNQDFLLLSMAILTYKNKIT